MAFRLNTCKIIPNKQAIQEDQSILIDKFHFLQKLKNFTILKGNSQISCIVDNLILSVTQNRQEKKLKVH